MTKVITVMGEPRGKARPRFTRAGHTYTDKTTVDYEKLIASEYIAQQGKYYEQGIPLFITIFAEFGIPKSKSKKIKEQMRSKVIFPTKKPDCDNVVKIICDALNNVAYYDDSQIVTVLMHKVYSDEPKVKIIIEKRG